MVQKPVKAVILLFPITDELAASRKEEDAKVAKGESGPPVDPTLVFIKQTVRVSRYTPAIPMYAALSDAKKIV